MSYVPIGFIKYDFYVTLLFVCLFLPFIFYYVYFP